MRVCPNCHRYLREGAHAPCDQPPVEVVADVVPPSLTQRFVDVEPFARGSVGTSYLARQASSGYRGLLKLIGAEAAGVGSERARLKRELRKQTTVEHEGLARLIDGGELGQQLWLFRDYIEGESLALLLQQEGALAPAQAFAIAAQVAGALDELHRQGLLHRDLKPQHILLSPNGDDPPRVCLIDASLAPRHASAGVFDLLGTPAYMSPEQASGKLVSFRSDLYALGCVLHEMLTGQPLFEGDAEALLASHQQTPPPAVDADLPDRVRQLLGNLLEKEPRRRPFSAQQVRRTLEPYLPAGTPQPQRKRVKAENRAVAFRGASMPPPPVNTGEHTQEIELDAIEEALLDDGDGPGTQQLNTQDLSSLMVDPAVKHALSARAQRGADPHTQQLDTQDLSNLMVDPAVKRALASRGVAAASQKEDAADPHTQQLDTQDLSALLVDRAEARVPVGKQPSTQEIRSDELSGLVVGDSEPPPLPGRRASAPGERASASSDRGPARGARARKQSSAPPLPAAAGSRPPAVPGSRPPSVPPPVPGSQAPAVPAQAKDEGDDATTILQRDAAASEPPAGGDDDRTQAVETDGGDSRVGDEDATIAISSSKPPAQQRAGSSFPDRTPLPGSLGHRDQVNFDVESLFDDESDGPPTEAVETIALDRAKIAAAQEEAAAAEAIDAASDTEPPPKARPWWLFAVAAALVAVLVMWLSRGEDAADTLAASQDEQPGSAQLVASGSAQAEPVAALAEPSAMPTEGAPQDAPQDAPEAPADGVAEPGVEADVASGEGAPDEEEQTVQVDDVEPGTQGEVQAEGAGDAKQADPPPPKTAAAASPAAADKRKADKAPRAAAKAVERKPAPARVSKSADDYKDEARAHYQAKRYAKAAAAYRAASEASPRDAGAFAGLGAALLATGKAKEAIVAYQRAVQLKPTMSGFHAALGRAYYQSGDRKRAVASYQQALKLNPENRAAKAALKQLGVK